MDLGFVRVAGQSRIKLFVFKTLADLDLIWQCEDFRAKGFCNSCSFWGRIINATVSNTIYRLEWMTCLDRLSLCPSR